MGETPYPDVVPAMADPGPSVSRLIHQPVTVDFIDNRLPRYHPAFTDPPVRYDVMSGQYFPHSQALVPLTKNGTLVAPISGSPALVKLDDLPPRPEWADFKAMEFWDAIFSEAMTRFKMTMEPKGRSKTTYNIRDKDNWDEVYDTLETARNKYLKDGGAVGWLRKVRRKAADKVTPIAEVARIASKLCPDSSPGTPVLGAVEVLFEVRQLDKSPEGRPAYD